jgi:ribose transport system ATP-binding protein
MLRPQKDILTVKQIVKDFPGVRALDHVDFSVRAGEVHCLLGENGAGKSTLIKILTGVYQRDEGEIIFEEHELGHITPRSAQQAGISAIYQEFQLVPTLSIAENIFLGREPINKAGKIDFSYMNTKTIELFSQLDLKIEPTWLVTNISVGLRQMTEVIKILARGSRLVIMDEPTTSLNEVETNQLFSTVKRMVKNGISIIYISHRMEEIFEVGDRASVLRDGKMIGTVEVANTTSSELISMMVGHTLKEKFYKVSVPIGDIIWRGELLSDETGAIRGVNFEVCEGEILGLFGIRGSGFKELARLIGGIENLSEGTLIDNNGKEYKFQNPQDAISAGVGYLPDDRKGEGLILNMSVSRNITLPILRKISTYGWVNASKAAQTADRFVRDLDIQTPSIHQSAEFLSGGNQQKIVLAKWLASQCKLLILDEPTQGIDVGAKIEMYKLIAGHVKSGGAVILLSSELPELIAIADRIIVVRDGKVVRELIAAKVSQEEVLHLAALGESTLVH